jgi:hypothetical protein
VMRGSAGILRTRHSTGSIFSTMQVGALLKSVQRSHQGSKLPPCSPQLVVGRCSVQSRGNGNYKSAIRALEILLAPSKRRKGAANTRTRRELAVARVL